MVANSHLTEAWIWYFMQDNNILASCPALFPVFLTLKSWEQGPVFQCLSHLKKKTGINRAIFFFNIENLGIWLGVRPHVLFSSQEG